MDHGSRPWFPRSVEEFDTRNEIVALIISTLLVICENHAFAKFKTLEIDSLISVITFFSET